MVKREYLNKINMGRSLSAHETGDFLHQLGKLLGLETSKKLAGPGFRAAIYDTSKVKLRLGDYTPCLFLEAGISSAEADLLRLSAAFHKYTNVFMV
jgi:hypothetical protein